MSSSCGGTKEEGRGHIILFPFMSQGHIIPFMALARRLEQKTSFIITLVNTPLNIHSLRSSLPPSSSIRLLPLPFQPSDHGLPPGAENTDSLPVFLRVRLLEASRALKPAFHLLLSSLPHLPVCITADFFFGWTVDIARQLGVFHVVFVSGSAYGIAVNFSLWLHLPHAHTDSDEFRLPDIPEAGWLHRSELSNDLKVADGSDPWSRFLRQEYTLCLGSDGFLFNTVEELEKTGLAYFRRKTGRPGWAIGPMRTKKGRGTKKPGISVEGCRSWLNLHRQRSVLFVSFGSQNTISASQMMQLAMGLEESGRPFIWVVRPPAGNDINDELRAEWLPEGFEDRVAERNQGLLVRMWAPQVEILSHESTGAFLSHCGWNSVLESLGCGVPMMGWPIAAEQFTNSKMLEEMGVCVEIARGNCSEVDKGHVMEVIEMVMGETKQGERMRRRALEIREIMEAAVREEEGFKGCSVKAMDAFVETISARKKKGEE